MKEPLACLPGCRLALALLLLSVLGSFSAPAAAAAKERVVVMDLKAERGLDPGLVKLLNELMLTELSKSGRYEVIGGSDIQGMLKLAEKRQTLGCNEMSCLVEIGGALGADKLVHANIGKVGNYYLVNVKIIDVKQAKVQRRVSYRVRGVEDALMQAISKSMANLTSGASVDGGHQVGTVEVSLEKQSAADAPGSLNTWGHVAFWTGAAGTAFGFAALGLAYSAGQDYGGGDQGAADTSRTWTAVMYGSFAVGAAAMATGVVLWLLDDDASAGSDLAVSAAPAPGGALLGLCGRW